MNCSQLISCLGFVALLFVCLSALLLARYSPSSLCSRQIFQLSSTGSCLDWSFSAFPCALVWVLVHPHGHLPRTVMRFGSCTSLESQLGQLVAWGWCHCFPFDVVCGWVIVFLIHLAISSLFDDRMYPLQQVGAVDELSCFSLPRSVSRARNIALHSFD